MKIIRQESFKLESDLANKTQKIDLPNDSEKVMAAYLSKNGRQLIKYWFDAERKFFNSDDATKIRNRASLDSFPAHVNSGRQVSFDNEMMSTFLNSYRDLKWDSDEYTFFFVGAVSGEVLGASANTSALGHNAVDDVINLPALNFTGSGIIRIPSAHTHANNLASVKVDTSLLSIPFLVTGTLSKKGVAIRFNGEEISRNPREFTAGNGLFRLWGENFSASQFNGEVGSTIICEDDLTETLELDFIENYLMKKYKIK